MKRKVVLSALIHKMYFFFKYIKYLNECFKYMNSGLWLLIVCYVCISCFEIRGCIQMSAATCRSCVQLGWVLNVKAWDKQRIPAGSGTVIGHCWGGAPPLVFHRGWDPQSSRSLIGQQITDSFKSHCSGNRSTLSVSLAVLFSAAARSALCLQNGYSTSITSVSRSSGITARLQLFSI